MSNQYKEPYAGGSAKEKAALDELERLRDEMVTKLPESVFVNKFLPLFASKEEDVDIGEWLNVCVNAYLPVDVVDGGEVLFRIPPLVKQLKTNSSRRGQDSVYELMETYQKKNSVNPNLGKNYLNRQLDARIERLGVTIEEVQTWNSIFTRYGYDPLIPMDETETPTTPSDKEDLFSDGYEPL